MPTDKTSLLSRTLKTTDPAVYVIRMSVHYLYILVSHTVLTQFVHVLLTSASDLCFGKLCDCPYLSKPWHLTAKLLIQITLLVPKSSPGSCQRISPSELTLCQFITRHGCVFQSLITLMLLFLLEISKRVFEICATVHVSSLPEHTPHNFVI